MLQNAFIVPTDAHYYKIVGTLAPICFGSRRNHHQGAVLCLGKPTSVVFNCARRYRCSQCYGGISAVNERNSLECVS
jgi:hypothetical protein